MRERPETTDSRAIISLDSSGKLVIPPSKELILGVANMIRGSGNLQVWRSNPRELMDQDSEALPTILAAAYNNSAILSREKPQSKATLNDVRQNFPGVIDFYEDKDVDNLILNHPRVDNIIKEELSILQGVTGNDTQIGSIKKVELLLRILNDTGLNLDYDPNSYFTLVEAHEIYQEMAKRVFEEQKRSFTSLKEQQNFTNLGQKLLKNRKVFELNIEDLDISGETRHADSNQDLEGRMTQLDVISSLHASLVQNGELENSQRIKNLVRMFRETLDRVLIDHPERFTDIRNRLGDLQVIGLGYFKAGYWVEQPGAPEFTPSEAQGFLHNE